MQTTKEYMAQKIKLDEIPLKTKELLETLGETVIFLTCDASCFIDVLSYVIENHDLFMDADWNNVLYDVIQDAYSAYASWGNKGVHIDDARIAVLQDYIMDRQMDQYEEPAKELWDVTYHRTVTNAPGTKAYDRKQSMANVFTKLTGLPCEVKDITLDSPRKYYKKGGGQVTLTRVMTSLEPGDGYPYRAIAEPIYGPVSYQARFDEDIIRRLLTDELLHRAEIAVHARYAANDPVVLRIMNNAQAHGVDLQTWLTMDKTMP